MDLDAVLRDVAENARPRAAEGEIASYIPSLAEADADAFGLALVELDGTEHGEGDVDRLVPIQSVSKVFTLALAMELRDTGWGDDEELWDRVGREPSGDPFNSLVQLEHEEGKPRNPMINAGALVVDDILLGVCDDAPATLLRMLSDLAGEEIGYDETVLRQEGNTGNRNRAMAHLMKSFGNIEHEVDAVLDLYVHQCAIAMTPRQLARATRFLANGGVDPATDRQVVPASLARRVAAIMLTCGTYDRAGEFAFHVGFPCKSGVSGAIIGVVNGKGGVCVWSPPLAPGGNSAAGGMALHHLSERLHLSLF